MSSPNASLDRGYLVLSPGKSPTRGPAGSSPSHYRNQQLAEAYQKAAFDLKVKEEVEIRLKKLTAEQRKKIEDLRAKNAELEELCNNLEGNLAASEQRCSGLEAEKEFANERICSLEAQVEQLKAELNEAGGNLLRKLARAAEEHTMAIEEAIIGKEKAMLAERARILEEKKLEAERLAAEAAADGEADDVKIARLEEKICSLEDEMPGKIDAALNEQKEAMLKVRMGLLADADAKQEELQARITELESLLAAAQKPPVGKGAPPGKGAPGKGAPGKGAPGKGAPAGKGFIAQVEGAVEDKTGSSAAGDLVGDGLTSMGFS